MDPWSSCSATCGGGSQTRSVRCTKGPEGRSRELGSKHCLGTGRKPSQTRQCNQLPCARWAVTHWGPVSRLRCTWTCRGCLHVNNIPFPFPLFLNCRSNVRFVCVYLRVISGGSTELVLPYFYYERNYSRSEGSPEASLSNVSREFPLLENNIVFVMNA